MDGTSIAQHVIAAFCAGILLAGLFNLIRAGRR
jgi:hypothetical protein